MKEQIIAFETAILAKEKGFNTTLDQTPTQSLLQKWIRETHSLDIIVNSNLIGYGYIIYNRIPLANIVNSNVYQTYEEALEKGLFESLKAISNS